MRKLFIVFVLIICSSILAQAEEQSGMDEKQKQSYSEGKDFGKFMKLQKPDIDVEFFLKGIRDGKND